MNSEERITAILNGKSVDRVVGTIITLALS